MLPYVDQGGGTSQQVKASICKVETNDSMSPNRFRSEDTKVLFENKPKKIIPGLNSKTGPCSISEEYANDIHCDTIFRSEALSAEPFSDYGCHGRAKLVFEQAQDIFRYKSVSFVKERDKASTLARVYGVSVKTIRDIWVGRTWYRATCRLDPTKPITPERLQKKVGRPKGTKDRTPRARKHAQGSKKSKHKRHEDGDSNCVQKVSKATEITCEPSVHNNTIGQASGTQLVSSWLNAPSEIPAPELEDPFNIWEEVSGASHEAGPEGSCPDSDTCEFM